MDTRVEVKRREQNPEDSELDITPMIDIVFLLLAFFVVVSKMDPKPTVDLPIAKYGAAINEKEAISMIVRYTGGEDCVVELYGRIQKGVKLSTDAEEQDESILAFVVEEFASKTDLMGTIIKVENGVKYSNTNRVFSAIKKGYDELGIEKPILVAVEEPQ